MAKITDMDIMEIENKKQFGDYLVARDNMEEFGVYEAGKRIYTGNDEEIADFLNTFMNSTMN